MPLATFALNGPTLIILVVLAVILFGRRLPEMGKSIGKSLKEFQKGMNGIEDEIDTASTSKPQEPAKAQLQPPQRIPSAVPKFDDNHVTEQPPSV